MKAVRSEVGPLQATNLKIKEELAELSARVASAIEEGKQETLAEYEEQAEALKRWAFMLKHRSVNERLWERCDSITFFAQLQFGSFTVDINKIQPGAVKLVIWHPWCTWISCIQWHQRTNSLHQAVLHQPARNFESSNSTLQPDWPWSFSRHLLFLNDRQEAISCWILANKLSLFSLFQDLCKGVFGFEIEQKLTSNETRKDNLLTIDRSSKSQM